jgi:hypothetical protein
MAAIEVVVGQGLMTHPVESIYEEQYQPPKVSYKGLGLMTFGQKLGEVV